jgi:hypothetical protein
VCIRRGQVHGFQNHGSVDAKLLAIASPGVFGPAYFEDLRQVLAAAAGGPPDTAAIGEVMRRHGLTPAQPVATCRPGDSRLPSRLANTTRKRDERRSMGNRHSRPPALVGLLSLHGRLPSPAVAATS